MGRFFDVAAGKCKDPKYTYILRQWEELYQARVKMSVGWRELNHNINISKKKGEEAPIEVG